MLRLRKYGQISVEIGVGPQFQVEGVAPTNHFSSQKTRLNCLSYDIKICIDLSSILLQITSLTDGQTDRRTDRRTDGRTDRILIAGPRLHSMQRGKNGHVRESGICAEKWDSPNVSVLLSISFSSVWLYISINCVWYYTLCAWLVLRWPQNWINVTTTDGENMFDIESKSVSLAWNYRIVPAGLLPECP